MSTRAGSPPGAPPRLVVALDGPGSSGKSSVGAKAAGRLGYRFFDTGLLYRAVTWLAIQQGIPDDQVQRLRVLVDAVRIEADEDGRLSKVHADGREVSRLLHDAAVDGRVSAISGIPEVRAALVERQRSIAADGGIIMAGRDIGTVILPGADLKLYLDASVEERARRRTVERGLTDRDAEAAEILAGLRRRDALDANREVAPLRPADDAVIVRTDGNTLEDTVAEVVALVRGAARPSTPAVAIPTPPVSAGDGVLPATASRRRRPLPVSRVADRMSPLILFCSLVGRVLARAFTRVQVEGDLGAIPARGPVLVIANHASNADGLLLGSFLPPRIGRPFNWLGKRELFDVPGLGWLAVRGGVHAVERSAVDMEAFRTAQRILDAGQVLAVFPEGTRSRTGALQPVKDGLAMLAQRSAVPVVPIAIEGSDLVWPRGRRLPRFGGRITVRVGAPLTLGAEAPVHGQDRRVAKAAATRQMMGAIAAMLPPRQRGVYADPEPES